ncbi:MotA/TolQ/ExbB proton channel [mine drainage metagenome]|uniref:MotA/TolQ/ExbB proton channel n=1 Tax=mine drainage metagenome TaxID=410659 RepID=T0ZN64_9ZZZZ
MDINYLIHIAAVSGGILYVMVLILLVCLVVIIDRTWYLTRVHREGLAIGRTVAQMSHLDRDALAQLAEDKSQFPQSVLIQVPVNHPSVKDPVEFAELVEEGIMTVAPRMDKGLWLLDTLVTMAPLLGLLGTIIGIFQSFRVLGNPGTAPTAVTGGVAEALIATAAGLFVAIISMIFYNGLSNLVRINLHHMETIKAILVNRLRAESDSARR